MKPTYPPGIDAAREREERVRIALLNRIPAAHFPLYGATQTTFKRITFEAAVAFAMGKMEQHRDARLSIQLIIMATGVKVLATSAQGKRERIITWHDLEMGQYDAFMHAINLVSDLRP